MSTNIVQRVHQKCLELHNFVPIFLFFFLGEDPRPPFHLYCLRMCFKKLRNFYTVKMKNLNEPYKCLVPSFPFCIMRSATGILKICISENNTARFFCIIRGILCMRISEFPSRFAFFTPYQKNERSIANTSTTFSRHLILSTTHCLGNCKVVHRSYNFYFCAGRSPFTYGLLVVHRTRTKYWPNFYSIGITFIHFFCFTTQYSKFQIIIRPPRGPLNKIANWYGTIFSHGGSPQRFRRSHTSNFVLTYFETPMRHMFYTTSIWPKGAVFFHTWLFNQWKLI